MVPENHHDRPLSVSAFWNLVADHNGMVECDREGLKGPYPKFFGSQSWTKLLQRIKYQEVLSKWNKKLLCTGQPTVALVAEAAGTPIGNYFPCMMFHFSARGSRLAWNSTRRLSSFYRHSHSVMAIFTT